MIFTSIVLTVALSSTLYNNSTIYASNMSEELNTESLLDASEDTDSVEVIFEEIPDEEVPKADEETQETNEETEDVEVLISEKLTDVVESEYEVTEEESMVIIADESEEEVVFDDDSSISMSAMATDEEESENSPRELQSVEYSIVNNGSFIFDIGDITDESYTGAVVDLDDENRDRAYHLVMGEAGTEGYEGAVLVAQAIRDAVVYKGYSNIEEVRVAMGYDGGLDNEPSQEVIDAVNYVFDQGGSGVQHKILYFYNPSAVSSDFHESQMLIIDYGRHRFFSSWD